MSNQTFDRPRIQEIAERARVSVATVSRVFNVPDLVKSETYGRVIEAANSLNYVPPQGPRRRRRDRPAPVSTLETIVYIHVSKRPRITNTSSFQASILMGAEEEASYRGLGVSARILVPEDAVRAVSTLPSDRHTTGFILAGNVQAMAFKAPLRSSVVAVEDIARNVFPKLDTVAADVRGSSSIATNHLIDLGHRRIAFVSCESSTERSTEQFQGFFCAHIDRGIACSRWTLNGRRRYETINAIVEMLGRADRPTAFVAVDPEAGQAIISACRQAGLRIPWDVSVIGLDAFPFAEYSDPSMSTVVVDRVKLGRLAVCQLIERQRKLSNQDTRHGIRVRLSVRASLVERASCCRANIE